MILSRLMLLILASVACSRRPAFPVDDLSSDPPTRGARALAEAIPQDLARLGPRGWLPHFLRDSSFYMASDGRLVFPSIASADSAIAVLALTLRSVDLRWLALRVDSLGPSIAALSSPFEETVTDTSGRRQVFRGFFSGIAVQVDSGWRLQSLHWSAIPPDSTP